MGGLVKDNKKKLPFLEARKAALERAAGNSGNSSTPAARTTRTPTVLGLSDKLGG